MICPHCQREIADNSNFCYYCGARQPASGGAGPRPVASKRLMRSATDQKIAGVCSGFADYFDADPTLVRLLWVLITFVTGIIPGIVVYVVAWLIMPVAPVAVAKPAAEKAAQSAQAG